MTFERDISTCQIVTNHLYVNLFLLKRGDERYRRIKKKIPRTLTRATRYDYLLPLLLLLSLFPRTRASYRCTKNTRTAK